MQQRVVVAMALACEPSLLIADEPATALDVTIQAQIVELLAGLRERRGLALLLISHDLGLVAELCDRVVVMYAGQIAEVGSVSDILTRPAHPYTRALLESLPRAEDPGAPFTSIPGDVPDPARRSTGCRFAGRCAHAWDRCRAEAPPLFPVEPAGTGRAGRCWLVEDAGRTGP
jgi:oligopeptide/dipeptide ABC transporter ATP-binding protein